MPPVRWETIGGLGAEEQPELVSMVERPLWLQRGKWGEGHQNGSQKAGSRLLRGSQQVSCDGGTEQAAARLRDPQGLRAGGGGRRNQRGVPWKDAQASGRWPRPAVGVRAPPFPSLGLRFVIWPIGLANGFLSVPGDSSEVPHVLIPSRAQSSFPFSLSHVGFPLKTFPVSRKPRK